jgi:hypothetical protein
MLRTNLPKVALPLESGLKIQSTFSHGFGGMQRLLHIGEAKADKQIEQESSSGF